MRPLPPTGSAGVGDALVSLLDVAASTPADDLVSIIDAAGALLGADSARFLVADYALNALRYLDSEAAGGFEAQPVTGGTAAGVAFSRGEVIVSKDRVFVPVSENSERLGVLELVHPGWPEDLEALLDPVVRILVLILVSKRRYTDQLLRTRRTQELSLAAEMQWGLLPPLSCSTSRVSVSGILQPAYSIGGDSFDFALNGNVADLAIIDAVGHGMAAVLISTVTINGIRNARREGHGLEAAYRETSEAIASQFSGSAFATGQIASLDLETGNLTWLNAGHPLPLLLRDRSYLRELSCRPSWPMGLNGPVAEVAVEQLQAGDMVLFYTDGATETRSLDGAPFGLPRLVEFLVRAAQEQTAPVETLRSLAAELSTYSDSGNDTGLSDDATLVMVEYHGS